MVTRLYVSNFIKQILTFYGNFNFAFFSNFSKKRELEFINFLFQLYSPHSHPDFPHSHPDSSHSYPDSQHYQHIPRIPTLIPRIPILIPRIPTFIPRVPTLIPRIPIIPLIPFPVPHSDFYR